jgi:hypothetical protein
VVAPTANPCHGPVGVFATFAACLQIMRCSKSAATKPSARKFTSEHGGGMKHGLVVIGGRDLGLP